MGIYRLLFICFYCIYTVGCVVNVMFVNINLNLFNLLYIEIILQTYYKIYNFKKLMLNKVTNFI